jgi:hypothetical protein
MSTEQARQLIKEADKTKAGIPVDTNGLIIQLMDNASINKELATRLIGNAIMEWRKNRPQSVRIKLLRAAAEKKGKPDRKDLQFADDPD